MQHDVNKTKNVLQITLQSLYMGIMHVSISSLLHKCGGKKVATVHWNDAGLCVLST